MAGRWFYNRLYRTGAPWEGGPRDELIAAVTSGRLVGGRALDVGCGSGANALFLAENGYRVTGIDFSNVALAKARQAAAAQRLSGVTFLEADLLGDLTFPAPFDLVVDFGTLDDFRRRQRQVLARRLASWTRSDGQLFLWCFYRDISWWRRADARFPGGLRPGEEADLFAADFDIERLPSPSRGSGFACFLMTRR